MTRTFEPQRQETYLAKIQISLRIRAVWAKSALGVVWIAKDAKFCEKWKLQSDCADAQPDLSLRNAQCQKVRFLTLRLVSSMDVVDHVFWEMMQLLLSVGLIERWYQLSVILFFSQTVNWSLIQLRIRVGIQINSWLFYLFIFFFFFLLLHENIHVCCGYSLEASRRGTSNEYPQHVVS